MYGRQTLYNGGADVTGTRIVSGKLLTVISGYAYEAGEWNVGSFYSGGCVYRYLAIIIYGKISLDRLISRSITFQPSINGPLPVLEETNFEQSSSSGTASPDEGRSVPMSI